MGGVEVNVGDKSREPETLSRQREVEMEFGKERLLMRQWSIVGRRGAKVGLYVEPG